MEIKRNPIKKAMFLIFFAVLTWWLFNNLKLIGNGVGLLLDILSPFIIGLVIAFILNKPMTLIENNLFGENISSDHWKSKYKRPISYLITLVLFMILLAIVLIIVIPNLVGAGEELTQKLPQYWVTIQRTIKNSSIEFSLLNQWAQNIDFKEVYDNLYSFVKGGILNWLGSTFTVFSSVIGGIISTGLGFVFSVYFLLEKEELIGNIKKLIYAVFPSRVAERTIYIGQITNDSFSQFLTGQSLDALALGSLFFIAMIIFRFPYAMMVSVIIAISAFVPIVGSFVGLVIGAFLIFVESPHLAGLFIILFLVLQQIEGNLIYPKVVGKASGLSSVWILAAVTLGGSLMGIMGIILFVPLFSVAQKLLKEYTDKRLEEKKE